MTSRTGVSLAVLLATLKLGLAAQKPFSVHDDVLAYPQFEIVFPDEYVLESDARSLIARASKPSTSTTAPLSSSDRLDLDQQIPLHEKRDRDGYSESGSAEVESYEEMVLHGQRFLCGIPKVTMEDGAPELNASMADEERELAMATDRGMELLRELEGKCLYYAAGWWSYSFCYMDQVRQFHALVPGNGVPAYPPLEDPATLSFVLGQFHHPSKEKDKEEEKDGVSSSRTNPTTAEVAARETRGDSWYLVQYLEDGTICDLTNRPRKIEVQFHCHPQASDHIGWIKEVSTCSYLMVIYTPRLCNDEAFQPQRVDKANDIACREVLTPEEVPSWEAAKEALGSKDLLGEATEQYPLVGDIKLGAMKLVGQEGKRIEKGKIASPVDKKEAVVARSVNGEYQLASEEILKELDLSSEDIEYVSNQIADFAQGRDWNLEVVNMNGALTFRGVVDEKTDGDKQTKGKESDKKDSETEEGKEVGDGDNDADDSDDSDDVFEGGSEETFKEEL